MSKMGMVSWKSMASHLAAVVLGIVLAFATSFIVGRYRFHEDIEQFQSQIQQDPKDADNWMSLGYIESGAHDDAEALAAFKKAIELEPSNFQPYFGIGTMYEQDGDYALAQIWYGDALKIAQKGSNSADILMVKEALKMVQTRGVGDQAS